MKKNRLRLLLLCIFMLIVIVRFVSTSNEVSTQDNDLKITMPELITCYPLGSNGNFVSRCNYEVEVEDYSVGDVCLELEDIYFENVIGREQLDLKQYYGSLEDYHYDCLNESVVEFYDDDLKQNGSYTVCHEHIKIVDKSYVDGNKICNKNHKRTISSYFDVPLGSSGKFDAFFPFLYKLYDDVQLV